MSGNTINMTYNNIIQGLRAHSILECTNCPYIGIGYECAFRLMEDAALLIEQQSNFITHLQKIQDLCLDEIMEEE